MPKSSSRRIRSTLAFVSIVGTSLIATSCTPASSTSIASAATEATIRIVVSHDASTTGTEVVKAVADDVDVADAHSVPELATTTIDVPKSQAAQALSELRSTDGVGSARIDGRVAAVGITPNDPLWSNQGTLRSIGVPEAWTASTGASSAVIAVIDTGVDPTSDLGGRLMAGYDFVNTDADPADDNGHGSDVASVIAAGGNDSLTMAGVCWSCRILPVKVLDGAGSGYMSDVASGIVWATNHGATIINLSLGSPQSDPSVSAAVTYAVNHDVVVVAAAGNDGTTNRSYPGADVGVLSVAASDPSNALYSWSQRGSSWVDVAAPGCNVADGGGMPGTFCGTSSATPVVAGTVGLLRSINSAASQTAVVNAVMSTAVPLSTAGQVASGRIDAAAAATSITGSSSSSTSVPAPPAAPVDHDAPSVSIEAEGRLVSGAVHTRVHASDPSGIAVVTLRTGSTVLGSAGVGPDGVAVVDWDSASYGDATIVLSADAADGVGNHAQASGSVTVDNASPTSRIYGPPNGRTMKGPFGLTVAGSDGNGAQVTIVVVNGRWVAVLPGNVVRTISIAPWANGKLVVVAVTVDRAGHAAFSNTISLKAALKRVAKAKKR